MDLEPAIEKVRKRIEYLSSDEEVINRRNIKRN